MIESPTLRELLNAFWLRPETALWREIDIRAMSSFELVSPSIDLGCGDGLFSFIRAGGRFKPGFDAFEAVGSLDTFFQNADVFDVASGKSNEAVVSAPPRYTIDVGFDHKKNLLNRAQMLGLYQSLREGDANKSLPFDDNTFGSLFSNIVYWLNDPAFTFREIGRILRPKGQACLMLPDIAFLDGSFYNRLYARSHDPRWKFLERLDRGRFIDNIKQAKASSSWEEMFKDAGLRVKKHVTHLSRINVQIWDVGLRPLFPQLLKMSRAMSTEVRDGIKEEWIENLVQFIQPLVELDESPEYGTHHGFHCYVLEKQ